MWWRWWPIYINMGSNVYSCNFYLIFYRTISQDLVRLHGSLQNNKQHKNNYDVNKIGYGNR